jgi:hypothetical protein
VCGSIPALKPLYDLARGKKSTNNSAYKLSAASSAMMSSKENYQGEMGTHRPIPPKAIAVQQTFETTSRCTSMEQILQPKPQ